MKESLLVLDGSSKAVYSLGPNRDGNYAMGHCLGRKIELVDSVTEAMGALEESANRPFGAVLTEPFMVQGRALDFLQKYQDFLKTVRTDGEIPVVLWSTQGEQVANEEYGLVKGVHYDVHTPKNGSSSPAEAIKKTIEQLLPQ